MDDDTLGGDDSVPVLGENEVDFQKVSGYITKARSVNKTPSQDIGDIIINSISNFFCTTLYKVRAETTNLQPFFENRLQQRSSSRSIRTGQLNWWISNLILSSRTSVTSQQVELLIKADASKTR